jgi:hypothetical protein
MDINLNANKFLFNSNVGDYYVTGDKVIEVTKRTRTKIYLSNGLIVNIRTLSDGHKYLDSKSVVRNKKPYPVINQILRDIEGYLIYLIHIK